MNQQQQEQDRLKMFKEALEIVRKNDYEPLYSNEEERLELAQYYAEMFNFDLEVIEEE